MDEQKDFSFGRFLKYALRHAGIAVITGLIGLGIGVLMVVMDAPANYEKYTATMRYDVAQYTALTTPDGQPLTEGDFALCTRRLAQILETARAPEVAAKTFAATQQGLYSAVQSEEDKTESFYESLVLTVGTDALTVSFTHDVQNEADRNAAKAVVDTYLRLAAENVKLKHPEFATDAYAALISTSAIEQDFQLAEGYLNANKKPGMLGDAVLGAAVGAAIGAVLVLLLYLLDPRIKSIKELLPEGKQCVVKTADQHAVVDFVARIKGMDARSILIAAPIEDAALDAWSEQLGAYLGENGVAVQCISLCAKSGDWFRSFDEPREQGEGYTVYLCNNAETGVIAYVSAKVDATALLINHKKVRAKALCDVTEGIADDRYACTLLHSTDWAYLD